MSRSIAGQLIDNAGSLAWLYNHGKSVQDVRKAIKKLRTTITELEKTLDSES